MMPLVPSTRTSPARSVRAATALTWSAILGREMPTRLAAMTGGRGSRSRISSWASTPLTHTRTRSTSPSSQSAAPVWTSLTTDNAVRCRSTVARAAVVTVNPTPGPVAVTRTTLGSGTGSPTPTTEYLVEQVAAVPPPAGVGTGAFGLSDEPAHGLTDRSRYAVCLPEPRDLALQLGDLSGPARGEVVGHRGASGRVDPQAGAGSGAEDRVGGAQHPDRRCRTDRGESRGRDADRRIDGEGLLLAGGEDAAVVALAELFAQGQAGQCVDGVVEVEQELGVLHLADVGPRVDPQAGGLGRREKSVERRVLAQVDVAGRRPPVGGRSGAHDVELDHARDDVDAVAR